MKLVVNVCVSVLMYGQVLKMHRSALQGTLTRNRDDRYGPMEQT